MPRERGGSGGARSRWAGTRWKCELPSSPSLSHRETGSSLRPQDPPTRSSEGTSSAPLPTSMKRLRARQRQGNVSRRKRQKSLERWERNLNHKHALAQPPLDCVASLESQGGLAV